MAFVLDSIIAFRNLLHGNLIFGIGALLLAGFAGGKRGSASLPFQGSSWPASSSGRPS